MTDIKPDPRDFLPLPPHDFQVLLSLAAGPAHAYGLSKAVEAQSDAVRLEIGSLYRMLARLTTLGLIAETGTEAGAGDGHERQRRYYGLTTLGRRVAEAESARLRAVLDLARRRRLLPGRRSS
ncbi:MAG: helix-turn-helix transcriptional regulator [Vicinamibacterales bacterium]